MFGMVETFALLLKALYLIGPLGEICGIRIADTLVTAIENSNSGT